MAQNKRLYINALLLPALAFPAWGKSNPSGSDLVGQEALVSLSEQKAIDALERILRKKQGSPEEADLLERLSELYLKQAKSVRFFALNTTGEKNLNLLPPVIKEKVALRPLQKAVEAFHQLQTRHPRYPAMDRIHFHKALTLAQMGLFKPSTMEVETLLAKYPKSEWRADAHLLIGEVLYDGQEFAKSLEHFNDAATSDKIKISQYAKYKAAWALYNLQRNNDAIEQLKNLVKGLDPERPEGFALRNESLRDMALFMTESANADEALDFFRSFTSESEATAAVLRMANIYRSHGKDKEARSLAQEYLKRGTDDSGKVQFHLLLAKDGKERKRVDDQVTHLQAAFDLCMIQPPDNEVCKTELRTQLGEAAEEAWKRWEKTKSPEHLSATKKILEIEIQRNPDPRPKTLEAYAELLFQSEDFENAARVYRDLSLKQITVADREKAQYGSLVALDRWMEKDKNAILPKEFFKEEVAAYLKAHPKSSHRTELVLQWANIQCQEKDYANCEKNLREVLGASKNAKMKNEMLIPTQNLFLESLKEQQKTADYRKALAQFISESKSPERRQDLRRHEAQMNLEILENPPSQMADEKRLQDYLAFLKKYEGDEKVTEPVFWKTLALALTQEEDLIAFQLISPRIEKNEAKPDPRIWDSLKQILVRQSTRNTTLETKPKNAKRQPAAQSLFEAANRIAPTKEKPQILWSYREELLKNPSNAAQVMKIEDELIRLGQDPEKSLILISRLEKDYAQGKAEKVFQETRPLVSVSKPAVVRAKARLLQARILEDELKAQRMKSSVSRLQLVVALKLEKLSKAQEAFMSALQLSNHDANVTLEARQGLKRVFEHSIQALKNVEIKDSISAEEKQSLDREIQSLISPLENQLQELIASEEVKS